MATFMQKIIAENKEKKAMTDEEKREDFKKKAVLSLKDAVFLEEEKPNAQGEEK